MTKTVVVTGAGGYIGGQTAIHLKQHGHKVIGFDLRVPPTRLSAFFDDYHTRDFADTASLDIMHAKQCDAIVHCGGSSLVGPSMVDPSVYYYNNFVKTLALMESKAVTEGARVIFSSSAAVYGEPIMVPVQEIDPAEPISPYGESKRMIEWLLQSYHRAYRTQYVAFRYFNACGADAMQRHGQYPGATHIIARLLESIRDQREFTLMGTDYDTPDGTCVRDYLHVADIAEAHVMALDSKVASGVYNLGSDRGVSNREIIAAVSEVLGKTPLVQTGPRRPGDPAMLTANSDKFRLASGWQPEYTLKDIIDTAWKWYNL